MSDPDAAAPRELADAMRTFLGLHLAALTDEAVEASPERARDAVAGLLETVGTTLPSFLGTGSVEVGRAMPADDAASVTWASAIAGRRLAEAEGALLHLKLALAAHAPTQEARARLHRCLSVARDALAGVEATLALWADAPRPPIRAREALRLARHCLVAGAPEAAAPLIRAALLAGLHEPHASGDPIPASLNDAWRPWERAARQPDVTRAATEDAWRATDAHPADAVRMWAAFDVAERLVNVASMTPRPNAEPESTLRGS